MDKLKHANSFKELIVYQKALSVAQVIFDITRSFPKEETYSLVDQMRRASRSIGAQIAESWAKRKYKKHFISKLTDAAGEQLESQHWVDVAGMCGYIESSQVTELNRVLMEVGQMLNSMINKADLFCGSQESHAKQHIVREKISDYFSSSHL